MKKILLILIVITPSMFAQNDGAANTGLSFLKLGYTSRSISMGDAVISNISDASATYYNPAALFSGSIVNILFTHSQNILGIRSEFLAGKVKMEKFAIGFHLINTAVNDIEIREIPGTSLGTFNAQNIAFGVSGAYKINEMVSIGVTTKFLYEKIYIDNASGYAFDFGGLYTKDKLSVGLSLSNFGSMSALRSGATKLPLSVRAGISRSFELTSINSTILISPNIYKVLDGGSLHFNLGAEFTYKDFLSLRLGYQTKYEDKSLTTGIGLHYKAFNLDYAFVPYKYSLGNSHTFTIGTSF